jgi:hypothetical protein
MYILYRYTPPEGWVECVHHSLWLFITFWLAHNSKQLRRGKWSASAMQIARWLSEIGIAMMQLWLLKRTDSIPLGRSVAFLLQQPLLAGDTLTLATFQDVKFWNQNLNSNNSISAYHINMIEHVYSKRRGIKPQATGQLLRRACRVPLECWCGKEHWWLPITHFDPP